MRGRAVLCRWMTTVTIYPVICSRHRALHCAWTFLESSSQPYQWHRALPVLGAEETMHVMCRAKALCPPGGQTCREEQCRGSMCVWGGWFWIFKKIVPLVLLCIILNVFCVCVCLVCLFCFPALRPHNSFLKPQHRIGFHTEHLGRNKQYILVF